MADDCLSRLQDAMDSLWFRQNILFFEPAGVTFQSLAKRAKPRAPTSSSQPPRPDPPPRHSTSFPRERLGSREGQSRESTRQEKKPKRLNIVIGKQLFQLQPPPRQKTTQSRRSLSELENYELKGFMDLGFTFPREKLSPQLMNTVPALHRLMAEGEEKKDEGAIKRPYLSEAWLIHRSPLLNLHTLCRSSPQGVDMKTSLRFWAREVVASMLHHES